jgi:hypothetical protein
LKQTSGFGFLKKIQTTNGFHERIGQQRTQWWIRVGPFMEFFDLIFRAPSKWSKLVLWFFGKQCSRVRTNNPSNFWEPSDKISMYPTHTRQLCFGETRENLLPTLDLT